MDFVGEGLGWVGAGQGVGRGEGVEDERDFEDVAGAEVVDAGGPGEFVGVGGGCRGVGLGQAQGVGAECTVGEYRGEDVGGGGRWVVCGVDVGERGGDAV